MKFFVTGGAGFIGSTLTDRLLAQDHDVVVFDNFSSGHEEFLEDARRSPRFTCVKGDTLDVAALTNAMRGCEFVVHLAANADVRFGAINPRRDLEQNTNATFNVLEAMRNNGLTRIAFSSTGSVYGDTNVIPTPEDAPFPIQTSFYSASKVACEGLIEAHCEAYGFQAFIFRFVSILGERYTHGHVFDFYRKLLEDPHELHVLGDGRQRKSYLYVHDCIDAMLLAIERANGAVNIFNLGTDEHCEVNDSVSWIVEAMGLNPKITYGGGRRGWVGDNPFIFLDCSRIKTLGWRASLSIREAVLRTLAWLQQQSPHALETRR